MGQLQKGSNPLTFSAPRVTSVASAASVTLNCDTTDIIAITALTVPLTLPNPTGTPVNGQMFEYRIYSAASQSLAYGVKFSAFDVIKPIATTAGKKLYLAVQYDAGTDTFDMIGQSVQL